MIKTFSISFKLALVFLLAACAIFVVRTFQPAVFAPNTGISLLALAAVCGVVGIVSKKSNV